MRAARALEALNFFLADVQAGIGPFIGVILLSRGWGADAIGSVMTLAGAAAMAATPLAGALVDTVRAKRALIVVATAVTALASLAMRFVHGYPAVAASQVVAAVSGAVLAPAAAGVTLGIVRRQGFDRQFGRNQMANHAGNVAGAALAGWLGWHVGFDAVFALVGVFTVLAIVSTLAIPGTRSITRPHGVSILQVPHRERMLRIHHMRRMRHRHRRRSRSRSRSRSRRPHRHRASAACARSPTTGRWCCSARRSRCFISATRRCCRSTGWASSSRIAATRARSPPRRSSSRSA